MKKNILKEKLFKNELTIGCWQTISHIIIADILAPSGFDWITVDMEHSSIELSDLLPLIINIEKNGMIPLVRVGENNPNLIKRVMDAGAYGIIVPNVCSASEAEQAVASVKYPPTGNRGVGLYRAQGFGISFDNYKKWLEEESIVIIQIEHINAVNNIEDIFRTPGIDAFMIGPYDLSGSLGQPGNFETTEFKNAIETVMKAAKRHNLSAGFHSVSSNPEDVLKRQKEGYNFLAFSLDSIFLGDAAFQAMEVIRKNNEN